VSERNGLNLVELGWTPNPSRGTLLFYEKGGYFSESEKNESVSAGLGALVPYGPVLGLTYLGQSFKIKVVK